MTRPQFTRDLITDRIADLFLQKVSGMVDADTCWEWSASRSSLGYGHYSVYRDGYRWYIRANRFAYLHFVGDIPPGMRVCHRCDNPACCNPSHLFLGTDADNMADKASKRRGVYGSDSHNAKLTEEQVQEIRSLYKPRTPGRSTPALAKKYGVSHTAIWMIVKGRNWKDAV